MTQVDDDIVIMHKFRRFKDLDKVPASPGIGVAIDTETTGLDHEGNKIIEVGIVQFLFDKRGGEVIKVLERHSGFEDPGEPLDEIITKVTGLVDADLAGKHFDDEKINKLLSGASLIIAHNAGFDRKFVEDRFQYDGYEDKPWVCSLNDYSWIDDGISSANLELLSYKIGGVQYDAHRALVDAEVILHNFNKKSPSGETYFLQMAKNACRDTNIIYAVGAPYGMKDDLKERGYRWNPGGAKDVKSWYIEVDNEEDYEEETRYLMDNGLLNVQVSDVTAMSRYSDRVSEGRHAVIYKPLEEKASIEM